MQLRVVQQLRSVSAAAWNRLAGDNPFLRHEFLTALESTGCVGAGTGWDPCHLVLQAGSDGSTLLGAIPLYLKHHSYGEYVFDWSWADAHARGGRAYYPKLVAAVPFTPATGRRLLIAAGADQDHVARLLIDGARELAQDAGASSLHWLFPTAGEMPALRAAGLLARIGCQFHWSNPGYGDFEDFLGQLTAHKRSNIRRERRRVRAAGVTLDVVPGSAVTPALWDVFYRFYRSTLRAHGAIAYLTREFFHALGDVLPDRIVLVVATQKGEPVGAALGLCGGDTYFGRYWGGRADIPGLHFETCYYTPIEYCIAQRLRRYEAGAQGEHKLARGFVPTPTYSAHWLRDPALQRAVAHFLEREQGNVGQYMSELNEHTPFRQPEPSPSARGTKP